MYVTIVYVKVKPQFIAAFTQACAQNHSQSVLEDGNLRFDILQSATQANEFILYEAYADAQCAARHKETAHYLIWRDTVAPWMEEPRRGVVYKGL